MCTLGASAPSGCFILPSTRKTSSAALRECLGSGWTSARRSASAPSRYSVWISSSVVSSCSRRYAIALGDLRNCLTLVAGSPSFRAIALGDIPVWYCEMISSSLVVSWLVIVDLLYLC